MTAMQVSQRMLMLPFSFAAIADEQDQNGFHHWLE